MKTISFAIAEPGRIFSVEIVNTLLRTVPPSTPRQYLRADAPQEAAPALHVSLHTTRSSTMPAVLDAPEVMDYETHDLPEAHPPGTSSPCWVLADGGAVYKAA